MTNNNNNNDFLPLLAAAGAIFIVGVASVTIAILEEEETAAQCNRAEVAATVIASNLLAFQGGCNQQPSQKRKVIFWDRDRAKRCIMDDYLGNLPRFSLDDFKRMFRVSRQCYNDLQNYLCMTQFFFRDGYDSFHREKISADARILMALKYLAYGCSVNSFRDYFQLGESTAMKCVKEFTMAIGTSKDFRSRYLPEMTPADAKRIEALHHFHHGVRRMIGSLDCSHFVWGNCPVAYHGQFQGKEEKPTIWDSSLLHRAFCDGSFSKCDFSFEIGGETFESLWLLVFILLWLIL
jgi:hypothetical protein